MKPLALAARISAGVVLSVRYSASQGWKADPRGRAARIRSRYAAASAVLTTGGRRFGITKARVNWRAVAGRTLAIAAPSRRCRCQSSGRVSVMVSREAGDELTGAGAESGAC